MGGVEERATALGHEVAWRQSDHEGELVGWLLAAAGEGHERGRASTRARSRTTRTPCATRSRRAGCPSSRCTCPTSPPARSSAGTRWSPRCAGRRSPASGPVAIIWRWRRCRGSPAEDGPRCPSAWMTLEVDAFLVPGCTNVRYLTGFTGSNGQALVGADAERVLHRRSLHRAVTARGARPRARDVRRRVRRRARGAGGPRSACARLGFEAHMVTVRSHGRLAAALRGRGARRVRRRGRTHPLGQGRRRARPAPQRRRP